jgi:tRNA dimethylallyltransferase
MSVDPFANALVLTGPTGSGKTKLGIVLAQRLGAEIISMDSMALYRGMDIGTAKPTTDERRLVPHHLVDVLEPWESASVAWWLDRAAECSHDIQARGKKVLFVGGTPLYLKALLYGIFEGPADNPALRARLEEEARQLGSAAMHDRLKRVDGDAAARIHPNDLVRIIRALEVHEMTGQPISQLQKQWRPSENSRPPGQNSDTGRVLCIDTPRRDLYAKIDARVLAMFEAGFVNEVRALSQLARPLSLQARQALGYQEVLDFLDGKMALGEVVLLIQKRSRNFAKRQLTWFRNIPGCRLVAKDLTFASWDLKIG